MADDETHIRALIERWARDEVTAGEDVAFAQASLRCGAQEDLDEDPDNRLRLTSTEGGRWVVAHEHHSFPTHGA